MARCPSRSKCTPSRELGTTTSRKSRNEKSSVCATRANNRRTWPTPGRPAGCRAPRVQEVRTASGRARESRARRRSVRTRWIVYRRREQTRPERRRRLLRIPERTGHSFQERTRRRRAARAWRERPAGRGDHSCVAERVVERRGAPAQPLLDHINGFSESGLEQARPPLAPREPSGLVRAVPPGVRVAITEHELHARQITELTVITSHTRTPLPSS